MKIAIVILNWNGQKLLEQFLPDVIAFSKDNPIYIADNASTDTSIAYVEETFTQVKIIKNSANFGYAKGYNQALKQVPEPIYCLLNSDIAVTPDWLDPIKQAFLNPEIAIAQPKILDYKKQTHFEYAGAAGGFIDKYGYPFCRGRIFDTLEKDLGQYQKNTPIFWASGACLFIRKTVFDSLQGFDTRFFAHQEEIDLCWRAQLQNHKVWYIAQSTVYHVGGATLDAAHPKKTFLNFRNSLVMLGKNLPKEKVFGIIFVRMVLDGIAAIRFLTEGKTKHFIAILKAHFSFYSMLTYVYHYRKNSNYTIFKHYKITSIVWAYFFKKRKTFFTLEP